MAACSIASQRLHGSLAPRPTAWRSCAPPTLRRRRLAAAAPTPRAPVLAAAAGDGAAADGGEASEFARLVAEGGKPKKTAVSKLPVAELRAECKRLQLPTDGLKADLVERLLGWWERRLQQAQEVQADAPAEERQQPPEAAAAEARAAPPGSTVGAPAPSPAVQQREQQQEQPAGAAPRVSVTWLGTSSGNPTPRRNVSSIAVRFGDDVYMVDCGEGTRNQLRRGRMDPAQIRRIFLTHMHGDHCFGTGGVLAAICEARLGTPLQHEPVHLYGPPEIQSLVAYAVKAGSIQLTTPVVVTGFVLDPKRARPPTKVDEQGMLQFQLQGPDQGDKLPPQELAALQAAYDQGSENIVQPGLSWSVNIPGGLVVTAAQLQHRVPCWGYVFQEGPTMVPPPPDAQQQGQQWEATPATREAPGEGERWVRRGRKLVILGDTCDSSAIAPLAMGCDMLSHEATFCIGMEEKAEIAQHSTTAQAGAFAASVGARHLVLTHFSARYESVAATAKHVQQSRRGPPLRKGEAAADVLSRDMLRSEMQRLLEETRRTYRRDTIYLANDFYTFDVAPHLPMTAEQLAAWEQRRWQQQQYAGAQRAQQPSPPQQQRSRWADQGQQLQWRPDNGGGNGQRRPSGGSPYGGRRPQQQSRQRGREQQWQPARRPSGDWE